MIQLCQTCGKGTLVKIGYIHYRCELCAHVFKQHPDGRYVEVRYYRLKATNYRLI